MRTCALDVFSDSLAGALRPALVLAYSHTLGGGRDDLSSWQTS